MEYSRIWHACNSINVDKKKNHSNPTCDTRNLCVVRLLLFGYAIASLRWRFQEANMPTITIRHPFSNNVRVKCEIKYTRIMISKYC